MNAAARALCCLAVLLIGLATLRVDVASAHGKEVQIRLDSWTPEPDQPLTRLYEAHVQYATDQEPVVGARLSFNAARQEDGITIDNIGFAPLQGNPGEYIGQVSYPRFGAWTITLRTEVPGVGEATTTEQLTPGGARSTNQPATTPDRLTVLLQFDWRDVQNIAVRFGHSVGAVIYLGATGLLVLNLWLGRQMTNLRIWNRLVHLSFPIGLGSLALIVLSGVYTGAADGPVRAPGVFDLQAMGSVPYGFAYLAAFWLKLILGIGVLFVLAQARTGVSSAGSLSIAAVSRLSLGYTTLVLLLLADVVVLVYLHSLSHLSAYAQLR